MSILGFLRKCGTYLSGVSGKSVLRKIETYPKTVGCLTFVTLSPLAHLYLKKRSKTRLEAPILARIQEGSKPEVIPHSFVFIERPVEEKRLLGLIRGDRGVRETSSDGAINEDSSPYFSVVLGPSGTGKTLLTRKVCMEHPVGVLYHEVFDPISFAKELGESVGMTTKPNSIIDLAVSSLSDTYHHYHTIPDHPRLAVAYVLNKIAAQALIFKKKYGYSPCLVLDGVDLIAKEDPNIFVYLIDRAKYLSNSKVMHIVLVSSEGSVLPHLNSTSSKTRIMYVDEIMDISENQAKAFLMTKMSEDVAQKVVSVTGGRVIHLIQALAIYSQEKDRVDRRCLPDIIESALMSRCNQSSLIEIMKQPTCAMEIKIIKHLAAQGITSQVGGGGAAIPSLVEVHGMQKKDIVAKAVEHLLSINVLRYKKDGRVAFHSRLVEKYVKEYIF